jgi:hypothetical protein
MTTWLCGYAADIQMISSRYPYSSLPNFSTITCRIQVLRGSGRHERTARVSEHSRTRSQLTELPDVVR